MKAGFVCRVSPAEISWGSRSAYWGVCVHMTSGVDIIGI